ncbi:MAG: hypothetical protein Q8N18_24045 [Opitutaceae bacterium]|nr:hypothetical protein [Opitutaceae bacterium]
MPALSLPSTLLVFALQCLVLSGAGVAAEIWRRRLTGRGSSFTAALALYALAPCALGYVAFVCYFIHPRVGHAFSWIAMAAILGTLAHAWLRPHQATDAPATRARLGRLVALMLLAGCFYISVLFIWTKPSFTATASHRFLPNMPGDPDIPRIFAERLDIGVSPKAIGGDWLSSDRPPLQTGIALVSLPALRALGFGHDKACATAGVWFQLLWIPALWMFLRWLGLTERAAQAAATAAVFTGFLLFNSVFVWPKLGGAALVLIGFGVMFGDPREVAPRRRGPVFGVLAACGALAHGGVMFSLLALAPLVLLSLRRRWRAWLLAAAVFAVVSLPWTAYQRFYEPPGNRLVKWHLGGQIAPDDRGALETLIDGYRALGWEKAIATRQANARDILDGRWRLMFAPVDAGARAALRADEFFRPFRAPAAWILGLVALPVLGWKLFRGQAKWHRRGGRHRLAVAWLGLTLAAWLALMFLPGSTLTHLGSYVVPLLLIGLLTGWAFLASRALFAVLALGQAALFAFTWMPPAEGFAGAPPTPFAVAATGVFGLALIALAVEALLTAEQSAAWAPRFARVRAWFRSPQARFTLTALAGFALLLFLRKPHTLTTPQLWAEDGSIFLMQADQLGTGAFTTPYMGYLHTLPRLIAAIAPRLLDPAWWPAFYNGVAFTIWLLVIARLFSPRLELPGKPWLALAFLAVPHSGEVMGSITNLQWITAFALLLQPLMAAPRTGLERLGDRAVLAVLALTGPFSILFAPLFAWRWWRDREGDSLAALLIVAGGAALQGWFVIATGPRFEHQELAFHLWPALEAVVRRLLMWPVLGAQLTTHLPAAAIGVIGLVFIAATLAWALRPDRWRLARIHFAAAMVLLSLAAVLRSRPDTWAGENFVFADRYFYIPRVLLVWLLVTEFHTATRAVAHTARAVCLVIALTHAGSYIVPAPQDYQWATQVEPIRRGLPARIPILPEGWILEYAGRPQPR